MPYHACGHLPYLQPGACRVAQIHSVLVFLWVFGGGRYWTCMPLCRDNVLASGASDLLSCHPQHLLPRFGLISALVHACARVLTALATQNKTWYARQTLSCRAQAQFSVETAVYRVQCGKVLCESVVHVSHATRLTLPHSTCTAERKAGQAIARAMRGPRGDLKVLLFLSRKRRNFWPSLGYPFCLRCTLRTNLGPPSRFASRPWPYA